MDKVTLALATLLCAGFLAAKLGQLFRLPSVTGYICAGLVLGPSGLNLITQEAIGNKLGHFTQIALMLIAFGIGEHMELKRLRPAAKSVAFIGVGETLGAFCLVSVGTFLVARFLGIGHADWGFTDFIALAVLLGAVSVATAPAATLHVMRELRAVGPLTSTLMAVVAVDDGLAIMIFGIAVSAAHHVVGSGTGMIMGAVVSSLWEIISSLLMGVITGLLINFIVHRLGRREEMLTAGLACLLLCGEGARLLDLSPLLAGMAAGFTIVNQDRRDVRLFRAINAFEPPIYVLFFTLAGAHLDLSALAMAGWVSLVYFMLRVLGKITGANVGGRLAEAPPTVRRLLGLALVPQAGVAIGLIFLIKGDAALTAFSSVIIPVVLGSVVLSELVGPVCARLAVERAGEAFTRANGSSLAAPPCQGAGESVGGIESAQLVPWTWEQLKPQANPKGVVIFGASHSATAGGLARMATLLAHYHGARPMAVRVCSQGTAEDDIGPNEETRSLFALAEAEVRDLGYTMDTEVVLAEDVAAGILSVARKNRTWGILLGHPIKGTAQEFQRVVDAVAKDAPCQVIVVRFAGVLHTERILVPVISDMDLRTIQGVISSLAGVGRHTITVLHLMHSDALGEEIEEAEERLTEWVQTESLAPCIQCRSVATEARLEMIVQECQRHDLLVMAANPSHRLQRFFFGSLAEDVAQHCQRPLLMVHRQPGTKAK